MRIRAILLGAAFFAAACGKDAAAPRDGEQRVRSLTVAAETLVELDRAGSADVEFVVGDVGAVFNHAVSTPGCQVSLRLAGDRTAPAEFSLRRVTPGNDPGHYTAAIGDDDTGVNYSRSVCIVVKLPSGELVISNEFRVRNRGYAAGITALRFLKKDNPSLPHDVELEYEAGDNVFTGVIDAYQRSMRLIAAFEAGEADRIEVGGEPQVSGESSQDFRREVVYTVYTGAAKSEYRVRVTNFTGLPVLWIETPGGQGVTSKEEWVKNSTMQLDGAGRFDDLEDVALSIRGRGNSTWEWPKKPFNLKLDSKTSVMGMPKHKRWCLLANYMDRTLLRNRIAYYLAGRTSLAWTPRCEFAEVFLNGEHLGQYLVTEHIKVDKNRVDITEMTPEDNEGEAVTGGYLMELDFHFDNVWQWRTAHDVPFSVSSPDDDELTPQQFAWIQDHIATVERTLYAAGFDDPAAGFRRYLDEESFVDYWLVYELTVNHELGNPGSVYLHKDRGGKIVAGPVWDFDWGTFSYNASPAAQWGLFMTHAWWYDRLFADAGFRKKAAERWRTLKPGFLTALGYIDSQRDGIARSAAVNFAKWPMTTDTNGDEKLSYGEAVDRMRRILGERIEIIDRELSAW